MITTAQFRADLIEFADPNKYTDALLAFWLNFASLLLNQDRWGAPAPFDSVVPVIHAGSLGANYRAGDILTVAGGNGPRASFAPTLVTVDAVDGAGKITAAHASTFGLYITLPTNPAAVTGGSGDGTAKFDLTYASTFGELYDTGQELMAAHNIVLERRALDEGGKGNVPGWSRGMINNMSVDKASVGYDTASAMESDAGHWNLTLYGMRFARLIKIVGAGPVEVNPGSGVIDPLSSALAFGGFFNFPTPNG